MAVGYQGLRAWSAVVAIGAATVASAQDPCLTDHCLPGPSRVAPSDRQVAPSDDENLQVAPARRPTMFAAPAPSGEVAGARRSLALPSLRISIPKISLETPEFRINGFTKFRRDEHMEVDQTVAPATSADPAIYGQLMGAQLRQQTASRREEPSVAPSRPQPEEPSTVAPGDVPCTQRSQSDEVRQLAAQVRQLQGLLLQIAEQQAAAQGSPTEQQDVYSEIPQDQPSVGMNARRGSSVSRKPTPDSEFAAAQQRQRMLEENYQRKCEELEAMQARMEQIQRQHKLLLENNLESMVSERETRLRRQMEQGESDVVQSSYEDVEAPAPMPSAPRKMPPRSPSLRRVPAASEADEKAFDGHPEVMRWKRS